MIRASLNAIEQLDGTEVLGMATDARKIYCVTFAGFFETYTEAIFNQAISFLHVSFIGLWKTTDHRP